MFSKPISCILMYFNVCGFYPEISTTAMYRNISNLSAFLHMILATYLLFYSVEVKNWIDDLTGSELDMINQMLQYLCAIITCWVIILESSAHRQNQLKFWQIFRHMNMHYSQRDRRLMSGFLVKFFEFFSFYFFSSIYKYIENTLDDVMIAYDIVTVLCINRTFYHLFYLELICFELEIIKSKANEMLDSRRDSFDEKFSSKNIKCPKNIRLKWFREYHQLVYELHACFNSNFGCSNVATILYGCNTLLTDTNFTVTNIVLKETQFTRLTYGKHAT